MCARKRSKPPEPEPPLPTVREVFFARPHADLDEQAELERTLIASIQAPNRVCKTTFRRRLDDLNEVVQRWLPPERPLHIMDTAISTGVTTWEWTESLHRHGIEHFMTAGDLNTRAYLFSFGRRLHAFVDEAGRSWQWEVNGKAFRNPPGRRNWLRHFAEFLALKLGVRLRFGSLQKASRKQGHQPVQKGHFRCHPLPLVHARLRQLPHVRIIEDDLCVRNPALDQQFHVVRAANILNKSYFDDATITASLINLRSRLKNGGLLVVCRTDLSGRNSGTVFRLDPPGTFTPVARIGAGTEIEGLVLNLG